MKRSHANCHYRTDLKSVDHEQFFDPLNYPRTSSDALRAAFRGQKEILSNLDADPLIKTVWSERLRDLMNKPGEELEIEDDREQEKDHEVEKDRDIDRGPTRER